MNSIQILLGFGAAVSFFFVFVGLVVISRFSFDWTPPAFAFTFIPLSVMMVIATLRQPIIKYVELVLLPIALSIISLLFGLLTHEDGWRSPWCIAHLVVTGTGIALWFSKRFALTTEEQEQDNT
jgi:hypothetical protein